MLQRILAPTDGSPESEKALPMAEEIARAQGAELLLLYIIELSPLLLAGPAESAAAANVYEELVAQAQSSATQHLAELETRAREAGIRARSVIAHGPAAATLLAYESSEQPDLLVMATHGRTGLARFALGSVADRLVREGTVPVLVTRRTIEATRKCDSALVMLDGSGVAEEILPMVESLAGKPLQELALFRVVADPHDRAPAMTYLEGVAARLERTGVRTTVSVDTGEPSHVAERAARHVDLVILCTHGRGGFDRLRHGSVAEYVMRSVAKPCLLVRAKG